MALEPSSRSDYCKIGAAPDGKAPDWFGSHGCVCLTEEDAKTLFDWTPIGTLAHIR